MVTGRFFAKIAVLFCCSMAFAVNGSQFYNLAVKSTTSGVGPAAHSYNRVGRQWNVSHLPKYLKAIGEEQLDFECEKLSLNERYNDYILTALRTSEGIDYNYIESKFGSDILKYTKEIADQQKLLDNVVVENNRCHLTEKGIFISDSIFAEFIIVEDSEF